MARRALELDAELAEAHVALGTAAFLYGHDPEAAEAALRRAVELNARLADAHHRLAVLLVATGRREEGLAEARLAQELEPFSVEARLSLSLALYLAGDLERAADQARRAVLISPDASFAHLQLAMVELRRGAFGAAEEPFAAGAPAVGMDPDLARRTLAALRAAREGGGPVEPPEGLATAGVEAGFLAWIYGMLGQRDSSLEALGRSVEAGENWVVWAPLDPAFDPVRNDPRFVRLLRGIGLSAG